MECLLVWSGCRVLRVSGVEFIGCRMFGVFVGLSGIGVSFWGVGLSVSPALVLVPGNSSHLYVSRHTNYRSLTWHIRRHYCLMQHREHISQPFYLPQHYQTLYHHLQAGCPPPLTRAAYYYPAATLLPVRPLRSDLLYKISVARAVA